MLNSTAKYKTVHGKKYLVQLCKHFGHKVEVEYTETRGICSLPPGPAILDADDTSISINVTAKDEDGILLAKHIIDSHIVKFAFRENLTGLVWTKTRLAANA